MLGIVTIGALIGLLPAYIAHRKGESFWKWWFVGALLFIVVLPAALLMKSNAKALEHGSSRPG